MIQQLNLQIARFTGLRFQVLSFPEPLEARFEADSCERRCRRLAFEGIFAILLFDLFLIADRLVSPADFHHALLVRLGILTPLALAVNFRLWRKPGPIFRESSIALVTALTGLSHLFLERNISAVNSAYALAGVLTVVVYANTAVRLRFPYAAATSFAMIAGDLLFLHADRLLLPQQKLLGLALTFITVAVSLMANYSANREERLNYLLALRGDFLLNDLHRSNQRLADIAETDGLTGLPNRLGFDLRFEALWRRALESTAPFSILMVDVDHFKRVNDSHGHLYGDKVLKRIAHLVLEALRGEHDFAARFGGEEFVVLLPETSLPDAFNVAERLRSLVHLAGFPPLDDARVPFGPLNHQIAALGATVSCGVATTYPRTLEERVHLLAAADNALYAAKDAGRNRVESAPFESPLPTPGFHRPHSDCTTVSRPLIAN